MQEADSEGVYLLNVAVDPEWRGKGCGKVMLEAAEQLISKRWCAKRIYAHVSKTNEVRPIDKQKTCMSDKSACLLRPDLPNCWYCANEPPTSKLQSRCSILFVCGRRCYADCRLHTIFIEALGMMSMTSKNKVCLPKWIFWWTSAQNLEIWTH